MAKAEVFSPKEVPVRVSAEVPTGCQTLPAAGTVVYPYQVGVVSNWDLGPEPRGRGHGWPPIERMPKDGMLMWLIMGDVAKDNTVEPWEGGGPLGSPKHFDYLAPQPAQDRAAGLVKTHAPPLSAADEQPGRWPGTRMWNRVICLADKAAVAQKEPYYLQILSFTGERFADGDSINAVVGSLQFEYT